MRACNYGASCCRAVWSTSKVAISCQSRCCCSLSLFFFFQAEDGIRDYKVTGVQTCALPIWHVLDARTVAAIRRLPRRPATRVRLRILDAAAFSGPRDAKNGPPVHGDLSPADRKSVV